MRSALVVSTGRTGTESVARNFSKRYPGAVALHEPFGSRLLRIAGNLFAAGLIGYPISRFLVRVTYGLRRKRFADRVYVESNPQMSHLIPVVCREYPDTVIVHIIRSPQDFSRSYIDHGAFTGFKGWLGIKMPFWFLRPEHVSRTDWPVWDAMSATDACIWRWSVMNESIERDSETYASRYVRILYEDLFAGPREWEALSELCGLDPAVWRRDSELLRTNRSRPTNVGSRLRADKVPSNSALTRVADQMARYGYDKTLV